MTESSFVSVNKLIAEPVTNQDVLRIIAKDAPRLSTDERETLRSAADEIETLLRAYCLVQNELIETRQHLIATNDQLIATRKQLEQRGQPERWSMSSGPLRVVGYCPVQVIG